MYVLLISLVLGLATGQQEDHEGLNRTSDYAADMPLQDSVGTDSSYQRNVLKNAASKAVQYLLNERDPDNGWGAFTSRAVVALSIADKELPLSDEDKQFMQKQLNIKLLFDFMENKTTMSLSSLALYINALMATCQDPRYFQGIDLVGRLRWGIDNAMKSNHSIPLAMLTLCLSDKVTRKDGYALANMYNSKEFSRTGSRALLMMAMTCIMRKERSILFQNYVDDFISHESEVAKAADIYSQALFIQAANSIGFGFSVKGLISNQLKNGSFGDMLSTYYAIPALLNFSLLDLKCDSKNKGALLEGQVLQSDGEYDIAYSLWIPSGQDLNSHSLSITFHGGKSFFDIMNMAASRNHLFRFSYEESTDGKTIYSIAGIPNDIERGSSWVLYSGDVDRVKVNSEEGLTEEVVGVDRIFPGDGNHFIFWLKGDTSAL